MEQKEIKLTQFAHGGGCGCKIAPAVLQQILATDRPGRHFDNLLVGNSTNDDAAAYDLGNGQVLIATTDFFMPVVDDAYDFGRVAAANSISDVYAMGGRPVMALAVLGWPVDKLPAELAQQVLAGARDICDSVNIPLAGGHSIDTTEPVFGLAVNGLCSKAELKRNNAAREGDLLFLTKPLGVGVLAAALKRGLLSPEHYTQFIGQLTSVNTVGEALGRLSGVTALTDVTGFGLAGHLTEMADGSGLSAEIFYTKLPIARAVRDYMAQKAVPDATYRNWNAYGSRIHFEPGVDVMEAFTLLPDPQTNGGLLIAADPSAADEVAALLTAAGLAAFATPIGRMVAKQDKVIIVRP